MLLRRSYVTSSALIAFALASATLAACTIENDSAPNGTDGGSTSSSSSGGTSGTSSSSGGSSGSPDGGGDKGECTVYTPASLDGERTGTFASAQEVVSIPLTATDVGGGLLEITVTAASQPLEVGLWLNEGEKKDEARCEGAAMHNETATFTVRLTGSKAYELRALPLDFREEESNQYTVRWRYQPLIDCYEHNDTRETAKRVPVDTPIEAYLHAGVGPDESRIVGASATDWYRFELEESKTVTLKANLPGDNTAYFSVRNAQDVEVTCNDPNFGMGIGATETSQTPSSCDATLAAGTYWVLAAIGNSEYPSTGPGEAVPTSWNTPYSFTLVTR